MAESRARRAPTGLPSVKQSGRRSSSRSAEISRSWLVRGALLLCLALASGVAHARKTVVFLGVRGPNSGQATGAVRTELVKRYRLVSAGQFRRTGRSLGVNVRTADGRSRAARKLRAAAVIDGAIIRAGTRWVLRLTVYSGASGRQVGGASLPLRGTRVDGMTARQIPGRLSTPVARARVGPPIPCGSTVRVRERSRRRARPPRERRRQRHEWVAEQPPPEQPPPRQTTNGFDDGSMIEGGAPPVTDGVAEEYRDESTPEANPVDAEPVGENLGFQVAVGSPGDIPPPPDLGSGQSDGAPAADVARRPDARPAWEKLFSAAVGVMVLTKRFDVKDPQEPIDPAQHPYYRSTATAAMRLEAELYPLSFFHRGPLANLGFVGRWWRVLKLNSQSPTTAEPIRTTLHAFEGGLRYRWNILDRVMSPTLRAGVEVGRLGFVIWDTERDGIALPDVGYIYLKLALVGLDVPFYGSEKFLIGASASFDYLLIFTSGAIERTEGVGYGNSNTGGIDAGVGLFGSYGNFFARLEGFYRRIFYDFDMTCSGNALPCRSAGGALDIYMGGMFQLGYAY